MRRFVSSRAPFQSYYAALACLTALSCGGHHGTSTPPVTGTSGTTGAPGASGTIATPTGTGGNVATGSNAGTNAAAAGGGAAGVGTTATAGTAAAPVAGTGVPLAGTGAAGTSAPTAGTGAMPAPPGPVGAASVLQFHKHATRDGLYVDAAFTRAASAMLKKDASFHGMTHGEIWAQPLYWDA